jgi:hypothetical protein
VALEDRLAGLLEMDPGDLLLYCPHPRMAMKVAEILVFWNGALRPLKDCSDDELVGQKLQSILDSHQNLWTIRVFLNPARVAQADMVAHAADSLLSFDASRKRRLDDAFYRTVIERRARAGKLGVGMEHETFEKGIARALEKTRALKEEARDLAAMDRIAREAFAKA